MACFASKSWASFYNVAIFSKRFQQVRNTLAGTSCKQWKQSLQQKSAKTVAATKMLVTGQFVTRKHFQQQIWGVYSLIRKTCNLFWIIRSKKESAHSIDKSREWKVACHVKRTVKRLHSYLTPILMDKWWPLNSFCEILIR